MMLYGYRQFHCIQNIYKDIAEDAETFILLILLISRFDTFNYQLYKPLLKRKKLKIRLDER